MMDLKGKRIYVTTNPELGWDCVTGVYLANSEQDVIDYLGEEYNEDSDVIHSHRLTIVKTPSEIRDEKITTVIGPQLQ